MHRVHYYCATLDDAPDPAGVQVDPDYDDAPHDRVPCAPERANLISSEVAHTDGEDHLPVLDLDGVDVDHAMRTCKLIAPELRQARFVVVPSSTPGNHHLYIEEVPLSWERYQALLCGLSELAILEPGYVSASLARRATFVRPPGVQRAVARA